MLSLDTAYDASQEIFLQPFVPEILDHASNVTYIVTGFTLDASNPANILPTKFLGPGGIGRH